MSGKAGVDPGRRGVLGALAAAAVALAAGALAWVRPAAGAKRGWRGFRRVKPWADDQLHRPHDDAG